MGATGTQDGTYDLLTVLYRALEGAESCEKYLKEAEAAGDHELCEFFRGVQRDERELSLRTKDFLRGRMGASEGESLELELERAYGATAH